MVAYSIALSLNIYQRLELQGTGISFARKAGSENKRFCHETLFQICTICSFAAISVLSDWTFNHAFSSLHSSVFFDQEKNGLQISNVPTFQQFASRYLFFYATHTVRTIMVHRV